MNVRVRNHETKFAVVVFLLTFVAYRLSSPSTKSPYDYTLRVAEALLDGRLGLVEAPPGWLNEMIPFGETYYSSFPLGSVLTMLPLAAMRQLGILDGFPGPLLASLLAGTAAVLFYLLAGRYALGQPRRLALALFPVLGTWMWPNLLYGGAWHIALGCAVVGQVGALYFLLRVRKPFIAGCFLAFAIGNRTELALLVPVYLWLLYRFRGGSTLIAGWTPALRVLAMPVALGLLTALYNFARFGSVFDFGYARIPGVLDEPWYRDGIFSLSAMPLNARAMLFETWRRVDAAPYLVPTGFGGSIFLGAPYLVYVFKPGARDRVLKRAAWVTIIVLTLVLWCHGNPGGWQVSYRYAMILLPWMFLVLLENGSGNLSRTEVLLLVTSVLLSGYSTYLFLWTAYMVP